MKLIEFDYRKFRKDLRSWLDDRGHGSVNRLALFTGVPKTTLARILRGEKVQYVETILSLASAIGQPLNRYLLRDPSMPRRGVDWSLFRECVSMLGLNTTDLAKRAGIDRATAASVLKQGMCRPATFLTLCETMGVPPSKFGQEWRREWELNKEGRSAVDRHDRETRSHVDHVRDPHLSFANGV